MNIWTSTDSWIEVVYDEVGNIRIIGHGGNIGGGNWPYGELNKATDLEDGQAPALQAAAAAFMEELGRHAATL
jgi:hypothetical protein